MEPFKVCRCCLSEGPHKDLHSPYTWMNNKEIYSEMLMECFNIAFSDQSNEGAICDVCVKNLRDSLCFKKQVVLSDQEFIKRLQQNAEEDKPVYVKLEPKAESDHDGHVSDTHSADDVKTELGDIPVKRRDVKKRVKSTKKKKSGKEEWRSQKIKTLVTRLASVINPCEIPDPKKIVKTRKITISTDPIYKDPKINLMWTTRTNHDKGKHRENLQTILKYSNATPFKNKSLLGYICGYCEATYPDPIDLRTHTETVHKKDRLDFKSSFDMTEYNVKLDVSDLICTLCDEKIDDLNLLKEHLVKIHEKTFHDDIKDHMMQFKLKKGDVYDCAMCTSTYETFKMLKQHMNRHYCNYNCPKCDSSFATKRSLNAHRTTHQEGSFKCDHCDKIFSSRSKKQYHEKTKHLGARNISNCPFCDVPFRSYYQRNQHLIKVHDAEAQYKCNICNKGYILKSLLMYHIKKNHLMERNCQCQECGYRFFSNKALKAHMVKHTGERKYACEVCHKSYARKYTLREHMRIHNNDRRFKCEVCGTAFVQKCSLKSHLLSHHGISMAACDITSVL